MRKKETKPRAKSGTGPFRPDLIPMREWKQIAPNGAAFTKAQRAALKRLGVSEEELAVAPPISGLLKRADGGIAQCISALRLMVLDEEVKRFLKFYDSLTPRDREAGVEAVCIKAGVDPLKLLGACMVALENVARATVRIIAVSGHPKVAEARVRFARLPGGHRDRDALDVTLGLLPPPRSGATFINKQTIFGSGQSVMDEQGAGKGSNDKDEADDVIDGEDPENIDLDKLFPSPRLIQEKLVAIREMVKALPPAEIDPDKKTPAK
jgi:hypothetical protein